MAQCWELLVISWAHASNLHLLQGGVYLLPCIGTQISLTSYRFTHAPPLSGSPARPSSLPGHTHTLTSHRRYAGKAEPWGTGNDPGRCCTPGTACPWAGPPGQGCPASSPWCPQMAPATHTSLCMEKWSAPGKSALLPRPDPHQLKYPAEN